jgi:hypothetical protein
MARIFHFCRPSATPGADGDVQAARMRFGEPHSDAAPPGRVPPPATRQWFAGRAGKARKTV